MSYTYHQSYGGHDQEDTCADDETVFEYAGEHVNEEVEVPEKPRPKLLEKAAVCLMAALLVWGLSSSKLPIFRRIGHYLSVALHTDFGTNLEQWGHSILRPLKSGGLVHVMDDWGAGTGVGTATQAIAEVWPIDGDGPVTAQYGATEKNGVSALAQGITIAATAGAAVQAVASGTVTSVLPMAQGSYQVLISHPGDWQTVYQGINVVYVQMEDAVTTAQHIGHVTQNGGLVFAVKIGQSHVDPLTVLPKHVAPAQ
ncbi:MAG TPA: hypothetical protein DER41_12605 [Firmicutes bacterium]|nr:hypothetical protein [Bacillota bacterium]HCF90771.1 hypothetical protein [Bacillota bacterium]